jgi:hypothetical protein
MTDCTHHNTEQGLLLQCEFELREARKEVMKLRTAMAGKVMVDADKATLLLELLYMYEDFDAAGQEAFDHLEAAIDQQQVLRPQPTNDQSALHAEGVKEL